METKIWLGKGYRNIRPTDPVETTKRMRSFAVYNNLRDCLFKTQGGWYKLCLDGTLVFATRTLYEISFEDLYYILQDHKQINNEKA